MNEQLINEIYNNVIKLIIRDITNEEEKNTMMVSYKEYLYDNYADTLDEGDNLEEVIALYSTIEIKKWVKKDIKEKQSLLLKDENFKRIQELSNIAYKHATRKIGCLISGQEYYTSLTESQITEYINEMNSLFEMVKECNKPTAKLYVSEGIQDLLYSGQLSNDMSLRVARLK